MNQSVTDCLGFDDRLLRLIGAPLLSLVIPFVFFREMPYNLVTIISSLTFTLLTWEGVRLIFIKVTKRFPDFSDWRNRLALIALLSTLYIAVLCPVVNYLLPRLVPEAYMQRYRPDTVQSYLVSYTMLLVVGAIYESMRFFALWKEALLQKQQVQRAQLVGQLDGLRNQVNPHFLFNSLNTLVYLIPEEPDRAVRFVQQLSRVYRYVLESREASLITLKEELAFLEAYIYLLKERFGSNIHIHIDTGQLEQDSTGIVPLSLQLLFENAIKHNVISAEKPLSIEVLVEDGSLVVRNTFQPKLQVMESTGVGLENIRLRFRFLTGHEVEVIPSNRYFTVMLPLVRLNPIADARAHH